MVVLYLSLIVLLPLAAVAIESRSSSGLGAFWDAVTAAAGASRR